MKTTTLLPPARSQTPGVPPTLRVPYQGLFREPVYTDGRPYDSDDEDQNGPEEAG